MLFDAVVIRPDLQTNTQRGVTTTERAVFHRDLSINVTCRQSYRYFRDVIVVVVAMVTGSRCQPRCQVHRRWTHCSEGPSSSWRPTRKRPWPPIGRPSPSLLCPPPSPCCPPFCTSMRGRRRSSPSPSCPCPPAPKEIDLARS